MTGNLTDAGIFLVQTFLGLYAIVVVLRFLIQAARADFYNPLAQAIIQLTNPALQPLRRILPSIFGLDLACIVLALAVELLIAVLVFSMLGQSLPQLPLLLAWCVLGLLGLTIDIYYFALIGMVILSWVAPRSDHPAAHLLYQLTEPLCAPARRLLPPIGGLDFSIILVFVTLSLLDRFLLVLPLVEMLGVPRGLLPGL